MAVNNLLGLIQGGINTTPPVQPVAQSQEFVNPMLDPVQPVQPEIPVQQGFNPPLQQLQPAVPQPQYQPFVEPQFQDTSPEPWRVALRSLIPVLVGGLGTGIAGAIGGGGAALAAGAGGAQALNRTIGQMGQQDQAAQERADRNAMNTAVMRNRNIAAQNNRLFQKNLQEQNITAQNERAILQQRLKDIAEGKAREFKREESALDREQRESASKRTAGVGYSRVAEQRRSREAREAEKQMTKDILSGQGNEEFFSSIEDPDQLFSAYVATPGVDRLSPEQQATNFKNLLKNSGYETDIVQRQFGINNPDALETPFLTPEEQEDLVNQYVSEQPFETPKTRLTEAKARRAENIVTGKAQEGKLTDVEKQAARDLKSQEKTNRQTFFPKEPFGKSTTGGNLGALYITARSKADLGVKMDNKEIVLNKFVDDYFNGDMTVEEFLNGTTRGITDKDGKPKINGATLEALGITAEDFNRLLTDLEATRGSAVQ